MVASTTIDPRATRSPARERLLSLDAFRGLTVAGMLLVNDPGSWGSIYPPLEHAAWHGWTPTDLIFPFFLFIAGITTHLSLSSRRARGDDEGAIRAQIIRRGVLIFGDAEDNELVAVLLLQCDQVRNLRSAGRTPRGPEVHEHDLALQIGKRDGLTVQVGHRERRNVHRLLQKRQRRSPVTRRCDRCAARIDRRRALLGTASHAEATNECQSAEERRGIWFLHPTIVAGHSFRR